MGRKRRWLPRSRRIRRLGSLVAEADRAAFIKESVDARFYDGKVKTAQFFAHHILPEVYSLASGIKADDRSALDIDFM